MISENVLTFAVITLALLITGYIVYYYYSHGKETTMAGYTFLPKDIVNTDPIFRGEAQDTNECIDRCIRDPLCHGMTFDLDSNQCVGSNDGQIRKDNSHYIAWEKGDTDLSKLFKTSLLSGYATSQQVVPSLKIGKPVVLNQCMFSFWVNVSDHYKNFEYWKHIFHKGTMPDVSGEINYKDWSDLITDYDDQYIGAWLAPFTNNMRIAITTEKDSYKQIEYHDINNIPINELFFVSVVIKSDYMEIYRNGKLEKIIKLDGEPQFNNSDLYIKNDKTFGGSLHNLSYIGIPTSHVEVASIYNEIPRLS